jgi:hypothetical protein
VVRVRGGEQQIELVAAQLGRDLGALGGDLSFQVGVVVGELIQLDEVAGAALEPVPRRDQVAMLTGFAGELAGAARVVPRAGLRQLRV